MPTFMAYYQTGDYGKLWFEAKDLKEAQDLLDEVSYGERMSLDDLPKLQTKVQGDELSFQGLTEVNNG
jgi:hypothetical protein